MDFDIIAQVLLGMVHSRGFATARRSSCINAISNKQTLTKKISLRKYLHILSLLY